ncbi:M20 metallopeptidase family protein [Achromobacter kerstersii]|uniref:N-acetylcysteine deacetylase n=1 Tax=Achromobacter kerstersii TaxID=1353890 RepID=A0A6S6Z5X3_9BURK|nr:amidohydrolase [Achromobacter kerstersii]CAB3663942.1 N-acetylcysteine deacetylase [Achromobacter kerstersii]
MKKRLVFGLCAAVLGSPAVVSAADVSQLAQQVHPRVVEWRRHIHQHPELGYQEVKTAAYVAEQLRNMPGMEVQTGIFFRSEVVSTLDGKQVAVMHACGHDTHVAMLLGAAQILSGMRDQLNGTVVFIFQPAEEGGGGAFKMIEGGVLDNPKVEAIFGQHISAGYPSGSLEYRAGGTMASADTFSVLVKGEGGHGSSPWAARDPIIATADMIVSLQSAIARDVNMSLGGSSMTVGLMSGGARRNVIPAEASFSGTVRTLNAENRDTLQKSFERIVQGTAHSHGVEADIQYTRLYPVTYNNPTLTSRAVGALKKAADGKVKGIPAKMGSEDFGAYGEKIPAFFWFLNASPYVDKAGAPNHSPHFVIDESAMLVGVRAMVETSLSYFDNK